MYDITKGQEEKPFNAKEFAVGVLVGAVPAILLGIVIGEPLFTFVLILICAQVVIYYRKRKAYQATWKTIIYAVATNVVIFMLLPMIMLVATT